MVEPRTKLALWHILNTVGVVLSLVVAVAAAYFSWEQAQAAKEQVKAAKEQNARMAGKIPARLELIKFAPNQPNLDFEARFHKPLTGLKDTTAPYFESVDSLLHCDYRVELRNAGEEPIEAIRVTVAHDQCFVNTGILFLLPIHPYKLEQVHKEEHILDQKLSQAEVVNVPLSRGIVSQILEAQKDYNHFNVELGGEFVIKCYGRIAGSTTFDATYDNKFVRTRLLWTPNGFKEAACQKLLRAFHPRIEIRKK